LVNFNYPLPKLLRKHKIFDNLENSILPKTNFFDEYMSRINKSGVNNVISFSLINNKINQSYSETMKNFEPFIQSLYKSQELSKNKINRISKDIDFNETGQYIVKFLENVEKMLCVFLEGVPGFKDLSLDYQGKIIKKNVIDFFLVFYLNFY
jgi:hypothetical protein